METLIIVLLIVVIVLLLFIIFKPQNTKTMETSLQNFESTHREYTNNQFNNLTDRINHQMLDIQDRNTHFEREISARLIEFQNGMNTVLTTQFKALQDSVENRLMAVDKKVSESLDEGFKKTNETFANIVARLSKIDEAQKKIDSLSTEIVSLQNVLTDKKTRGTFGEVQLSHILSSIFGENNEKIYELQYSLKSGVRADAVLFAPEPLGTIAIDSKFPLENYRKTIDTNLSDELRARARKDFVSDCKSHIDAIAQKYIVPGETTDQAIMFVPAEAIFATINAYHEDILDYSQKKRVWLTSPTTLMSTLTTIQIILKNMDRDKYASIIHDHLKALSLEFSRYNERWQKLSNRMAGLSKDFKDINITTNKITSQFEKIENVEIENEETAKLD